MDSPASSAATPPPSDPPSEAPRRRSGAQKRKSSSSSSAPSKRLMKERNALNIHSSSLLHTGPVTRARQSPAKFAVPSPDPTAGSDDVSGRIPIVIDEEEAAAVAEEIKEEPVVDLEFDAIKSRGSDVHVVPVSAGWFSWKDIHSIERHSLASFFDGKLDSRTPEIYIDIRNSIMKKFHFKPQAQLEVEDLSDISIGDIEAKQEVMEFLAYWGLINFHPSPPSGSEVSNSENGEDKTLSSLVDKLYKFETPLSTSHTLAKKVEVSVPTEMPKVLPDSAIAEDLLGPVGPSVEYHCNSCSADCSRSRYHCQKQADFDLCTECYNNGKFGSGMTSADFILMEPAEVAGVSGGSWTDQETLLLLEALELFGENWNDIAEHVATKTKAQCILHFLQMPIEDPFLDGGEDSGDKVEQVDPISGSKENDVSGSHETMEVDRPEGTVQSDNPDGVVKAENPDGADHTNIQNGVDQPNSAEIDILTKGDASKHELPSENDASFHVAALKDAFQAIGLIPEGPEQELPSFAEAGNPVMALAAFLTRLVEPDAVKALVRSSLKAMSEDSPDIQLAARHCFILEDPPNDMKNPPATDSAVTAMVIMVAPKEEDATTSIASNELKAPNSTDERPSNGSNELKTSSDGDMLKLSDDSDKPTLLNGAKKLNPRNGSDEPKLSNDTSEVIKSSNGSNDLKPPSVSDGLPSSIDSVDYITGGDELKPSNIDYQSKPLSNSGVTNDSQNKNDEDAVPVENVTSLPVSSEEQLLKTPATKESADLDTLMQATTITTKEPGALTTEGAETCNSPLKDTDDSVSPMILTSTNLKELDDLNLQAKVASNASVDLNVLEVAGVENPDSLKNLGKLTSVGETGVLSATPMAVDNKPASLPIPCEEPESQQKVGAESKVEGETAADGNGRIVSSSDNEKNKATVEISGDHKMNKLKRAAAAVLSAAAVKAKFLAVQEEEQIRHLTAMVIEKQLHKLDAKLGYFTDIENVVVKFKEQIYKARQKLALERDQIVAIRKANMEKALAEKAAAMNKQALK